MLPKGEKALMVVFLRGTGVGLPFPYNLVRGGTTPRTHQSLVGTHKQALAEAINVYPLSGRAIAIPNVILGQNRRQVPQTG